MRGTAMPVRVLGAVGLSGALLFGAGCGLVGGGADKQAACTDLEQTFTDLQDQVSQQASNPQQLAPTLREGAQTIREQAGESGDTDVMAAADKVANEFETLAEQLSAPPGEAQAPDMSAITSAARELQDACNA